MRYNRWIPFSAMVILGYAIGSLTGYPDAGSTIGVGVGFFLMEIIYRNFFKWGWLVGSVVFAAGLGLIFGNTAIWSSFGVAIGLLLTAWAQQKSRQ